MLQQKEAPRPHFVQDHMTSHGYRELDWIGIPRNNRPHRQEYIYKSPIFSFGHFLIFENLKTVDHLFLKDYISSNAVDI